jgi:hypothetical protein
MPRYLNRIVCHKYTSRKNHILSKISSNDCTETNSMNPLIFTCFVLLDIPGHIRYHTQIFEYSRHLSQNKNYSVLWQDIIFGDIL